MPSKDLDDWILQIEGDSDWVSPRISTHSQKIARQKEWVPRVDVLESAEAVIITIEIAGVKSGQVGIFPDSACRSMLVRGERFSHSCEAFGSVSPHQIEIECGQFAREITLPDVPLDFDRAQAQMSHGMLTVIIPKRTEPIHVISTETRIIRVKRIK